MTPELLLFGVRLALALALYVFLAAVVYVVWRDLRAATATAGARQRRLGRLVVLDGAAGSTAGDGHGLTAALLPEAGGTPVAAYPLLPVTSLGRAPTNTAALSDETASLEHALLTLRNGQWWLEDLGSRNGTAVNGAKIDQPVVVTAGDVIGIGRLRLVLELD